MFLRVHDAPFEGSNTLLLLLVTLWLCMGESKPEKPKIKLLCIRSPLINGLVLPIRGFLPSLDIKWPWGRQIGKYTCLGAKILKGNQWTKCTKSKVFSSIIWKSNGSWLIARTLLYPDTSSVFRSLTTTIWFCMEEERKMKLIPQVLACNKESSMIFTFIQWKRNCGQRWKRA